MAGRLTGLVLLALQFLVVDVKNFLQFRRQSIARNRPERELKGAIANMGL
jgi:hypothetical protein